MTTMARAALAVAAVAAVANWIAVARSSKRLEYAAKPLTMVALIIVAVALDPSDDARRVWFVAAAVLSLAGDVFLMLPRDVFRAGLVAFLLAHICYIVGFLQRPMAGGLLWVGAVLVAALIATLGVRVLRAVRTGAHRSLFVQVVCYLTVISTMVVVAFGTGPGLAIAGAVMFFASDGILAEQRFVRPHAWAPVAVMVTYHLGQAALILSLA